MEISNSLLTIILSSSVLASLIAAFINIWSVIKNQKGLKEIEKLKKQYDLIYKKIDLMAKSKSELMNMKIGLDISDSYNLSNLKDYHSRLKIYQKYNEDFINQRSIYFNIEPYMDFDLKNEINDNFLDPYEQKALEYFEKGIKDINENKVDDSELQKSIEIYFASILPYIIYFRKTLCLTIDNQIIRFKKEFI